MNTANVPHPARETLEAFGLGKLSDSSMEIVARHLESCSACQRLAAEAPDDYLLEHLRQANDLAATPAPAQLLVSLFQDPELPVELRNHPQYEILRKLGTGGMGVVYLVRNRWMNRLEVHKVIRSALIDRAGVRERFLREIRAAAALNHENVVKAYSALSFGDHLVFAMEYAEGEDLAGVMKTHGPLPIGAACHYARQAALGLQHAHERGMVHRDVKPSNLILTREGARPVVKILDFGLVRAGSDNEGMAPLTEQGKMLGTPEYMAPEQIRDAASADVRADVYSLGCTLYQMLTGVVPFQADSLFLILQAHQSSDARPVHRVRPEAPAALAGVVARMMAKDPARRYQTPGEVARDLAPFVREAPFPLPNSVVEGAARAEKQRSRRFLRAGAVLAGVLLAAGVVITITLPDGKRTTLEVPDGSTITIEQGGNVGAVDAAWLTKVAALPVNQQAAAVADRLKQLNPGFDGKVTSGIESDVVTALEFSTNHVRDLSPVRALTGLRRLGCGGTHGQKGGLADLSPLAGMKLASLSFYASQVSDLSPLRGMPLTSLNCGHSRVSNLSPLAGMKLTYLDCYISKVSDLSPLKGMPLTYLNCGCSPVSDLAPLKDMNLKVLAFWAAPVCDLSPLKDMNLRELICAYTPISDLSPLKDMKMKILHIGDTRVTDLSPLRGMPLTELWCDFQPARDAEILRSLKTLETINDKRVAQFWKEMDKKNP